VRYILCFFFILPALASASVPQDELKNAKAIVAKLHKCLAEGGESESMIRACGAEHVAKNLSEDEQNRLWSWMQLNRKVKAVAACPNEALKFLPEEKMRDVKAVACADYKFFGRQRRAIFFFADQGGLRLANVRIDDPTVGAPPVAERPKW
jgi:hypothetical protein